jgi:uncharacterized surface protein with fasciclin (FAS1) repeats
MIKIRSIALLASVALPLGLAAAPVAFAQMQSEHTVTVGGAPMYPSKNIIENAINSQDHTTLVAAVKAAGLVETLEGPGPFTVFAPTNEAFDKLPPGTVANLVKPENKDTLVKILTYHVVPGRLTAADLMRMVRAGKGSAQLKTVQGEILTVSQNGNKLFVSGAQSGVGEITITDVLQSNGVIQVVSSVLLPS